MQLVRRYGWLAMAMLTFASLSGCATTHRPATANTAAEANSSVHENDGEEEETAPPSDPLRHYNRSMFAFNDKFDYYLLKPTAILYKSIMPRPLFQGVHNVFVTISEPAVIANDILQGNFYQSAKDFTRLSINLTVGLFGLIDVAGRVGLPHFSNDFGLTLAYWGYERSTFLVLPFLGPNTIRDGLLGLPVDYYLFYPFPDIKPDSVRFGLIAWFFVDFRANQLELESVADEIAIDKYIFMRNAYLQRRKYQLEQLSHLSYKERKINRNFTSATP